MSNDTNETPKFPAVRWFKFGHLPAGEIQDTSEAFSDLAAFLSTQFSGLNPEAIAGFRKLLEAKDCFVRAVIFEQDTGGRVHGRSDATLQ